MKNEHQKTPRGVLVLGKLMMLLYGVGLTTVAACALQGGGEVTAAETSADDLTAWGFIQGANTFTYVWQQEGDVGAAYERMLQEHGGTVDAPGDLERAVVVAQAWDRLYEVDPDSYERLEMLTEDIYRDVPEGADYDEATGYVDVTDAELDHAMEAYQRALEAEIADYMDRRDRALNDGPREQTVARFAFFRWPWRPRPPRPPPPIVFPPRRPPQRPPPPPPRPVVTPPAPKQPPPRPPMWRDGRFIIGTGASGAFWWLQDQITGDDDGDAGTTININGDVIVLPDGTIIGAPDDGETGGADTGGGETGGGETGGGDTDGGVDGGSHDADAGVP